MISVPLNPLLTRVFVVLLALAFVLAPVASAQDRGAESRAGCAHEEVIAADEAEDHASHPGAHSHGCGGCHAHMMGCEAGVGRGAPDRVMLVPTGAAGPPKLWPDGLFRPPRA